MKDDLPRGEENVKHLYIEKEGEERLQKSATPMILAKIDKFFKLGQRMVQAIRIIYEPLMDYLQKQMLILNEHIMSIEDIAHKKNIVAQKRQEKVRKNELIKAMRPINRAFKEAIKIVKAINKKEKKLILKKWKEDGNRGQKKKILQYVLEGGLYSKHIPNEGNSILSHYKVNQRIAKLN